MSPDENYAVLRWPLIRRSHRHVYRARLKVLREEPLPAHRRTYVRRFYAHGEPWPLHIAGRRQIVAYACHNCGSVHSLKQNAYWTQEQIWTRALECCRRPTRCKGCGAAIDKNAASKCNDCWSRERFLQDRNTARKALIVADTGDPVWCHWSDGEWGEGYSSSLDAHLEHWHDDHGDDEPPPPFVCATTPEIPRISPHHVLESLTEDLPEDFDAADLPGAEALLAAIEAFNAAQGPAAWMVDHTRVIVLDPARFEDYLATDHNGLPDVRYRSSSDPGTPARKAAE